MMSTASSTVGKHKRGMDEAKKTTAVRQETLPKRRFVALKTQCPEVLFLCRKPNFLGRIPLMVLELCIVYNSIILNSSTYPLNISIRNIACNIFFDQEQFYSEWLLQCSYHKLSAS